MRCHVSDYIVTVTVTVHRHRQNLAAAKITPHIRQLLNNIRFHAVCITVTVTVMLCNQRRHQRSMMTVARKQTAVPLAGLHGDAGMETCLKFFCAVDDLPVDVEVPDDTVDADVTSLPATGN